MKVYTIEGVQDKVKHYLEMFGGLGAGKIELSNNQHDSFEIKLTDKAKVVIKFPALILYNCTPEMIELDITANVQVFNMFSRDTEGVQLTSNQLNLKIKRFPDLQVELK